MCLQCCPVPYNVCSIFFSWSLFLSDEIQIISTYILLCLSNIFQEDFYNFFFSKNCPVPNFILLEYTYLSSFKHFNVSILF